MAKWTKLGQYKKPLVKAGEDGKLKTAYLEIDFGATPKKPATVNTITLAAGDTLRFETKVYKLAKLEKDFNEGTITEQQFNDFTEAVKKIPDFVLADVVLVQQD